MEFRVVPSKVLLFGEYTILSGSHALILPFHGFTGRLEMPRKPSDDMAMDSNRVIRQLVQYLREVEHKRPENLGISLARMKTDAERGLSFVSSIPESYGLGSSGALCAALYHAYSDEPAAHQPLPGLRQSLARMESFFHGTSSGIDPLCIYTGKPLLIRSGKDVTPWNTLETETGVTCWLADTGIKADTGHLVDHYRFQLSATEYRTRIQQEYIPAVNLAVDAMVAGKLQMNELQDISRHQIDLFAEMIPNRLRKVWKHGIETGDHACKLCGSGGGGMMLVFTRSPDKTAQHFYSEGFGKIIPVNLNGFR